MAEDGDGGDGVRPGGETWELAKLIGNYETFTEGVERRLGKIEESLEHGASSFSSINATIAKKSEQIDGIEKRLKTVEDDEHELSKRRRWQIDGTTIAAIILAFKEIVTAFIGLFHG